MEKSSREYALATKKRKALLSTLEDATKKRKEQHQMRQQSEMQSMKQQMERSLGIPLPSDPQQQNEIMQQLLQVQKEQKKQREEIKLKGDPQDDPTHEEYSIACPCFRASDEPAGCIWWPDGKNCY